MVCDKVYNAREIRLSSDGKFDRNGVGFKPFVHHTDSVVEVCARDVHLVYESKTGYAIFVGLTPYRFGLRLDAALGAKQCDCTVKDTKASFDFNGKVNVTRGIDNVYTMVFPVCGGSGGSDGNTSFLLLLHPVHRGGTLVRFAEFMNPAGIKQDTLGRCGLSRIDMSHDTYISYVFKRNFSWHSLGCSPYL